METTTTQPRENLSERIFETVNVCHIHQIVVAHFTSISSWGSHPAMIRSLVSSSTQEPIELIRD